MRACLILCLIASLGAGEATLEQRISESARALVVLQRADGGWGIPPAPEHQPARRLAPRRAGDPPWPPVAPEHAEREQVPLLCRAAEALWSARPWLEQAASSAAKAHSLAARALLAHRGMPPDVAEAVAYLRAELARSAAPSEGSEAEAARLCQGVLDAALERCRRGDLLLGICLSDRWDVDLRLTWLARPLDHRQWHCWLPFDEGPPRGRIDRRQPLLPPTRTDAGIAAQPPIGEFEDASPFAAAFRHPDARVQAWMRPLCEAEDVRQADLLRLVAWAEACVPLYDDPPEAWWRGRIAQWDQALRRRVQRHASPAGPIMLWHPDRVEEGNPDGLLWLSVLRRIAGGELRRDWQRTHVSEALPALAAQQREDGSWAEDPPGCESTALACLAFLGAGYDHKTPNRFRRAVRDGLAAIRAMPDAAETRSRAVRLTAIAEAYAMTSDPDLRQPAQVGINRLVAERLPGGGWGARAGGPLDWPATTSVLIALRSASAGGVTAGDADAAVWWPALAGDGAGDPPMALAWKAVGGVFLGQGQRAQTEALTRRLCEVLPPRTPEVPADAELLWLASLAIFQLGGEAWLAWEQRMLCEPLPPAPTPAIRAQRLLADEILYRYAQMRPRR